MQWMPENIQVQNKSNMQPKEFANNQQMKFQTQQQTQGYNLYTPNLMNNHNENCKGQKCFNTNNINSQNQTNFQHQGIAMPFNQFQIKQFPNQIEQQKKEREGCIQDLMNIAQKSVQRRKERVTEKYLEPNQNKIEEYLE